MDLTTDGLSLNYSQTVEILYSFQGSFITQLRVAA